MKANGYMGTVCCSLFFCSKFYSSIPNGRCRGEIFNVACYVTYGRVACGTLSISKDGKAKKENLFWEKYMSCTGVQMCYSNRVTRELSKMDMMMWML